MTYHSWFLASCLALLVPSGRAAAQTPVQHVKVGVLTDMSGPTSDVGGPGSVLAAEMAVEEYGRALLGDATIEIVHADHQVKADVAAALARRWLDTEGVDAILDVPFSAAALAVNEVVRQNGRAAYLVSGGGTAELTGAKCSPNTVHWTYDTWSVANSTARAVVSQGGKSWFFLTSDYAFGHALEIDGSRAIKAAGGQVLGSVSHPYNSPDMSAYVLQAMASKAQVIGLANSSVDAINSVKQAHDLGAVAQGMRVAALIMLINDVHGLGLEAGQGLYLTEPFYWDLNDRTRAFSDRFASRLGGRRPSMIQAGVYASMIHYMKAVRAAGTTDGLTVVAKMKELPTDDPLFGRGSIRADGRTLHDMYILKVKTPAQSQSVWDLEEVVGTIPAEEAFGPANPACTLGKA